MTTRAPRGKRTAIWVVFTLAVLTGLALAVLYGADVPTLLDSVLP